MARVPNTPLVLVAALSALTACADPTTTDADLAPIVIAPSAGAPDTTRIPNRYIVVLRPGASDPAGFAARVVSARGGTLHHVYRRALLGFAATLSPEAVQDIKRDPAVAFVERDGIAHVSGTQNNPPWGLDRIDQRSLPRDATYGYAGTGSGVTVYVIDTGIKTTHTQFGGRATVGYDATGGNGIDCNGHGTHVAGTIGGSTYGVAKGVSLVAVRVFGSCGSSAANSTIIAGVDWVTANAALPAVANMSLGGMASAALDSAVRASIQAGVTYAVAAGNSDIDACTESPARVPQALTVGATDSNDVRSSFSNWGPCVDVFAPGSYILSAWYSSTTAAAYLSGTSMASPHVAGVAALWLATHPLSTPAEVADELLRDGSAGRLIDVPNGTANALLFAGLALEAGSRIALSTPLLEFRTVVGAPEFVRIAGAPAADPASPQNLTLTNTGDQPVNWEAADNKAWVTVTPASGALAPGESQALAVAVRTTGLPAGTYEALVRVSATGALNAPAYSTVRLHVLPGTTLTSGVAVTGIWGDGRDSLRFYRIVVPAGVAQLQVATSGGSGDADLFVKYGAPPTASDDWTCASAGGTSTESCTIANPAPGDWWIQLQSWIGYAGVTLTATLTAGPPPAIPATLVATVMSSSRIDLAWSDNSSDESRFELRWRSQVPGGTYGAWTTISPKAAANTTTWQHTGLAGATVYQHRVRACNYGGCSGWRTGSAVQTP